MAWFKKILSVLLSAAIAFTISVAQAQDDSSDHDGLKMLERCKSEGASRLVLELMKDNRKEWDEVVQKISTGDWQWIYASACLSHGVFFADAAIGWDGDYANETLMEAWSAALLNNPEDLLKQSHEISLSVMCSFPLYLFDGSVEFADDFLEKALASLERVDDDVYLQAKKEACKTYLKHDYKRYITYLEDYKKPH